MLHTDYSKLFASGLRVMAHRRQRPSSLVLAGIVPPCPKTPEAESSKCAQMTNTWKTLLPSKLLRRGTTSKKARAAGALPSREAKTARRRTLPNGVVHDDLFEVWISGKSPLGQDTTTALLHTHVEATEGDDTQPLSPKAGSLDPSSPSQSFVITLTDRSIPPSQKDESFLSFSASSTDFSSRERPVSIQTLPVPIRLPSHPYRLAADGDDHAGAGQTEDDWRQFHVEWIGQYGPSVPREERRRSCGGRMINMRK